jgi:ankyrin repeat protein
MLLSNIINGLYKLKNNSDRSEKQLADFIESLKKELNAEQIKAIETCANKLLFNAEHMAPNPEMGEYKSLFNYAVYHELFAYTELAFAFEKNGRADEHAKKLALMFGNTKEAIAYVMKYAKEHPDMQCIHDACLFALPPASRYAQKWIALSRNDSGKLLFDPTYKRMLSIASDLEKQMEVDIIEKETLIKNAKADFKLPDNAKLAIKSIQDQLAPLNKFCNSYDNGQLNREQNKTEYLKNIQQRQGLRAARACLRLNQPFKQYNLEMLHDYYERYSLTQDSLKAYFTSRGINDHSFKKFLGLDRRTAGQHIPDVIIDGADLGHPGYYLRKLHVQDEQDAAIGACLGKDTDCCQSLSGEAGEPCAIHGLTNPNGAFYVLFKGDAKNPKQSDPVYAQAWAWRGKTNAIVLDSIETRENNIRVISSFYNQLAHVLVAQHSVPRVSCGASSGVSKKIGTQSSYRFHTEVPLNDYTGYRDSHKQLYLADSDVLLLHNGNLNLKAINQELALDNPIHTLGKIVHTVGFLIMNNRGTSLKQLKSVADLKEERAKELQSYVTTQEIYYNALVKYGEYNDLQSLNKILELVEKDKINPWLKIRSLHHYNDDIEFNFLYFAIKRRAIEAIKILLKLNHDLINMNVYEDTSPVFFAFKTGNVEIVNLLLSHEPRPDINAVDFWGRPILYSAIQQNKLTMIDLILEHKPDLNVLTDYNESLLHVAVDNMNLYVTEFILKHNRKIIDVAENRKGRSALHYAVLGDNLDMVRLLLKYNPNINAVDKEKMTALGMAIGGGSRNKYKLEMVKLLLEHKADINSANDDGNTILHQAIQSRDTNVVQLILEHKPKIDSVNNYGHTALQRAIETDQFTIVHLILAYQPNTNSINSSGDTALHVAVESGNFETIQLILLEHKPNINALNNKDKTALQLALEHKDTNGLNIMRILIENGADLIKITNQEKVLMNKDQLNLITSSLSLPKHSKIIDQIVEATASEIKSLSPGMRILINEVNERILLYPSSPYGGTYRQPKAILDVVKDSRNEFIRCFNESGLPIGEKNTLRQCMERVLVKNSIMQFDAHYAILLSLFNSPRHNSSIKQDFNDKVIRIMQYWITDLASKMILYEYAAATRTATYRQVYGSGPTQTSLFFKTQITAAKNQLAEEATQTQKPAR